MNLRVSMVFLPSINLGRLNGCASKA